MKFWLTLVLFILFGHTLIAQQQVTIISECGGWDTVTIPNIIDNDLDGMDDALEQQLLDHFMPYLVKYNSDDCPGPNTDGTGDTNLVVSRIFPVPQQYTSNNSIDSVKLAPTPIVPARGLTVGLYWYPTVVKINSALLYGKDCGLTSHTADVEGFNFSIKYTGPLAGGWMHDTDMQNWIGGTIQTISHAGTFCEAVQTFPYRSAINPTGKDTIYPSPDKHGNFLTVAQCSSNFICDPACSGAYTRHKVKNVNLGEPNNPLVNDLGTIYAPYTGEDPWGPDDFLNGGAGSIESKMTLELTSAFIQSSMLSSQAMICNLYRNCYGTAGSAILAYTCIGTPYNFYGQQLTAPGTYTETLQTPYGCDSVMTLTLQVDTLIQVSVSPAICQGDVYMFSGQALTMPGTYVDTFTAQGGCDSVVTLQLTVDTVAATLINASICDGDFYQFNGLNIVTTGTYIDTLAGINGCDSVVTLQLQVFPLPNTPSITVIDATLSTDTTGFDSYQWYLDGNAIPGADAPTFNAPTDGYYSVGGFNADGCRTLSDSVYVDVVGIGNVSGLPNVKLYPNPAQQQVVIEVPQGNVPLSVTIFNVSGQRVYTTTMYAPTLQVGLSQFAPGLYFVRLSGNGFQWNGKLVRE